MTRLNRWLVLILVLQGGLLGASRLIKTERGPERPRRLFENKLDPKSVSRLRVTSGEKKVVELARRGEEWVLASGGGFPALKGKVNDFLSKLSGLRVEGPVSTRAEHQRTFELAADAFQREVKLEQAGKPALSFYLGTSAGMKDVHLRLADDSAIYLAKELSSWDAGATAADWVSTDYLKVERERVQAVEITNKHGTIKLAKGSDGKWAAEGLAEGVKLKDSEVESLLSSVTSVSLQEPVGTKEEPAQGLDAGATVITVEERTGAGPAAGAGGKSGAGGPAAGASAPAAGASAPAITRHVLRIGARVGDTYYAKLSDSPYIVKVSSWTADTFLNKKLADLEQKESDKKDADKKANEGEQQGPAMPGSAMPGLPPGEE